MPPRISILIPNWNGEAFLERCLAGTIRSAQVMGEPCEIVVVDDASSDRSVEIISSRFPDIKLIRNPLNIGFGASVNRGAELARGEFLVLLNNDLVPKESLVAELISPLAQSADLFGVTGKVLEWNGTSHNHLRMHARWRSGMVQLTWSDPDSPQPTMFLLGGCMAARRDEFIRLGGFSPLFAPGYWEDYDLSYLALKCGWRNLYAPHAQAWHFGQASMKRAIGAERISLVRERNFYLFQWLNLTDPDLLQEHARALPGVVFSGLWKQDAAAELRARGLREALPYFALVNAERRRRFPLLRRTDREVLADFSAAGFRVGMGESA